MKWPWRKSGERGMLDTQAVSRLQKNESDVNDLRERVLRVERRVAILRQRAALEDDDRLIDEGGGVAR